MRLKAIILGLIASLLITGAAPPQVAVALSGKDFKAGRIIDDPVFYNRSAMSAAQIQNFLNAKVPSCDSNGTKMYSATQTRKQYAASKGVSTPFICLKSYKQNTPYKAGESGLCSAISAKSNRSAANIINDIAQACDISAKVILVILNKEQGLVVDDWPWPYQYRSAMGFGCPDSADCDSEYYGFFNQVYHAALQYKRYRADPENWNHIPFMTNQIWYQANAPGCGKKSVYIENQATAGLYNYTPYTPNKAALDNLYGTGDSCSAYGNRNFWVTFNDWFGSTLRPWEVEIQARYDALTTQQKTSLGSATSSVICGIRNNGCYKKYQNGAIVWTSATGAWETYGPMRARWVETGTENGKMGYPTGPPSCGLTASGCWQKYEYGYIVYSPASGAWESMGGIRERWKAAGSEAGSLGYPAGPEVAYNNGWFQKYQNGYIVGKVSTGFWISDGDIRNRWVQLNAEAGELGYPTGPTNCGLTGDGCWQGYEHGYLIYSSASGAWESKGGIRQHWTSHGAENGSLGYPAGPETTLPNGWFQKYQNGYIIGNTRTGFWTSDGAIRTRWVQIGAENGKLGYPTGPTTCELVNSGCRQPYEKGYMVQPDATQAWESTGGIRRYWVQIGAENGKLGYPTGPEITLDSGGWSQKYTNGFIIGKTQTGFWESEGPARTRWIQLGSENGKLGYPTSKVTCGLTNSGCYQAFERGYLVWSQSTSPWESLFGPIRTKWLEMGAESGALGYPTGPLTTINSTTTEQQYSNGTIHFKSSPRTTWVTTTP